MKTTISLLATAALLLTACQKHDTRPLIEASFDVIPCPQTIDTLHNGTDYVIDRNTVIHFHPETSEMKRQALFLQEYIEQAIGLTVPVEAGIVNEGKIGRAHV